MRRIADRISIFALALLLDAAAQLLVGPPPQPHPTWLAYALHRLADRVPAPRLRPVAPVLLALLAARAAALLSHPGSQRPARPAAILLQAALLASTFDAWRSLRHARRAERQLAHDTQIAAQTGNQTGNQTGAVEIELGRLAQSAADTVVGPWAAYALADLPGAVAWAALESISADHEIEAPLAALLESSPQLAAVRQTRDAVAGAATLAAARGGAPLSLHMDDIVDSADAPLAVTAMTVALNRRIVWNGRISGWQRPPPDRHDLRRANRIALRALALLAAATAAAIAAVELLKPPHRPSRPASRDDDWRRQPPDWNRLFDLRRR